MKTILNVFSQKMNGKLAVSFAGAEENTGKSFNANPNVTCMQSSSWSNTGYHWSNSTSWSNTGYHWNNSTNWSNTGYHWNNSTNWSNTGYHWNNGGSSGGSSSYNGGK